MFVAFYSFKLEIDLYHIPSIKAIIAYTEVGTEFFYIKWEKIAYPQCRQLTFVTLCHAEGRLEKNLQVVHNEFGPIWAPTV